MSTRRRFLAGGLAGLLPPAVRAQGAVGLSELLSPLMTRHRVPGVSAALIRRGGITERVTIGAGPLTLFQAASISKVVTALVVLRLVERGRFTLDAPVNDLLRSWKLPGALAGEVTARLLLCHRAGTTVPGFPGYSPGAPLPDLLEILDGAPPANTRAVRAEWPPGAAFRYSGGGTMVLQQVVQDMTGQPFDTLAREFVLAPIGMTRSFFFQPLPAAETDAAVAHDIEGHPLTGRFRVYPEHAAAGLWSTSSELVSMALAIAASWTSGNLLEKATARLMATPVGNGPTGLGFFVQPRDGRPPYLYHYGVNVGFRSVLVFAADASFGVALMTNGEGGRLLIPQFLDALFRHAGQEPFRPAE